MPVSLVCPNPGCGRPSQVPAAAVGRKVQCPACGRVFTAAPATPPSTVRRASEQTDHPLPSTLDDPNDVPRPAVAAGSDSTRRDPSGTSRSTLNRPNQSVGRFEVRGKVGEGAFGAVYRAFDPQLDREVALKVPHAAVLDSPNRVERFLREARAAANLRHPHIVPVFDAGSDGGRHYIASAFIAGQKLADAIEASDGAFDVRRAARLVRELAEALAYAHGQGVVHRDVKPDNLMLDQTDRVHLMDFGLAVRQDAEARLTSEGAVMGTPAYMAPEQAKGQTDKVGPAADQYACGVVLYELLTGQTPFVGPAPVVIHNQIHTDPAPPGEVRADIPKDLETVCLKAMSKRAGDRYPDCQALADDLRRWLEGEPVSARRTGVVGRAVRWVWKHPAAAGLLVTGAVAGVLLVVAIGFAVLLVQAVQAKKQADLSKGEAEEAKDKLTVAAADLKANQQRLEVFEYGRTVQVAERLLREGKEEPARTLLDGTKQHLRGWEWDHVNRLDDSGLLFERKLESPATWVQWVDGSRVLASAAGTGHVWDVASGTELLCVHGPQRGMGWSPDGSRFITPDRTDMRVWNANTEAEVCVLPGQTGGRWSRDGKRVLTTGTDQTVRVWDAGSGAELFNVTIPNRREGLPRAEFSPDGGRVFTFDQDGRVQVWEVATRKQLAALPGDRQGPPRVAEWSPDGSRIMTITQGGRGRVWEADTGKEVAELADPVHSFMIAWSPDGSRVLTVGGELEVRLWDAKTGLEKGGFKVAEGLSGVSWSPDGSLVLLTSHLGRVRVCDPRTGAELLSFRGHTNGTSHAVWSPDGTRILTAGGDGRVRVWSAGRRGATVEVRLKTLWDIAAGVQFHPDGSRFMVVTPTSAPSVFDAVSGVERVPPKGQPPAAAAALSPDGTRMAVLESDQILRIRDADTRAEQTAFKGRWSCLAVAWSHDGKKLVGRDDFKAYVWTVDNPTAPPVVIDFNTVFNESIRPVAGVGFSPDGRHVLTTGSPDAMVRVWDTTTGKEAYFLQGPKPDPELPPGHDVIALGGSPKRDGRQFLAAAWNRDGSRIVAGNQDGTVRVWDTTTQKEVLVLTGHTRAVRGVVWSPDRDGSRILTVAEDGTARLWDSTTGADLLTLDTPERANVAAAWSSDGKKILIASSNGDVFVWDVTPRAVPPAAAGPLKSWTVPRSVPPVASPESRAAVEWVLKAGGEVTLFDTDEHPNPRTVDTIPKQFKIRRITLRGGKGVTDDALAKALAAAKDLTELELADLPDVTDAGVAPLKGGKLTKLCLERLPKLTTAGAVAGLDGTALRGLVLNHVAIGDDVLTGIARHTQLTTLVVRRTTTPDQLTKEGYAKLAGLTKLTALDLSVCGVTDDDLALLANMTELANLSVCENPNLTGSGFRHLRGKAGFRSIDTWGTPVNNAAADHLAACTGLEKVGLSGGKLTAEGAEALAGSKSITVLDLNSSTVGDGGVRALAKMKRLVELNLSNNQLTGDGIAAFAGHTNLARLMVGLNKVDRKAIEVLAALPELTELSLAECKLTDTDVEPLGKPGRQPPFRRIDLTTNPEVSDTARKKLAESLPGCEILPPVK